MAELILVEILIFFIGIILFKGDIFDPSLISIVVFLIATALCIPYVAIWNIHMYWKTVVVIGISLCAMLVCSYSVRLLYTNTGKHNEISQNNVFSSINIGKQIRWYISLTVVILTIIYGVSAYRLGRMYGGVGLNSFAYLKDAYMTDTAYVKMNVFIRQGYKIVMAFAYIACLLLTSRIIDRHAEKREVSSYILWIFCGGAMTLMSGSRTDILRLFCAFVIDYSILSRLYNRNKLQKKVKSIFRYIIPLVFLVVITSFSVKQIVKTADVELSQTTSMMYYLAYYVGSPIAVLNSKISIAFASSSIFSITSVSLPNFMYLGNLNYGGNVATILWPTLQSNGMLGIIFKLLVMYAIGELLYVNLLTINLQRKVSYGCLLLFSILYQFYVMSYYSDSLYVLSDLFTNSLIFIGAIIAFIFFVRLDNVGNVLKKENKYG